jgi:hypothetical protein
VPVDRTGRSRAEETVVSTIRRTTSTFCATACLLAAGAPAAASATGSDLRSPDARDAAGAGASADAVAVPRSVEVMPTQDLRTPDAQDAAFAATGGSPSAAAGGGFDFTDAAAGAGGMLGLLLGCAGAGVLIARHRQDRTPAAKPSDTATV